MSYCYESAISQYSHVATDNSVVNAYSSLYYNAQYASDDVQSDDHYHKIDVGDEDFCKAEDGKKEIRDMKLAQLFQKIIYQGHQPLFSLTSS